MNFFNFYFGFHYTQNTWVLFCRLYLLTADFGYIIHSRLPCLNIPFGHAVRCPPNFHLVPVLGTERVAYSHLSYQWV